jgi:putative ATPase
VACACEGDARRALTALEIAVGSTAADANGMITIDQATAEESMQQKAVTYGDDGHYDTISAFIKSMRGSDPHAAIYWLAKMLAAGEEVRFIARRLVIFAAEDVGNADPRALPLTTSAMQAVEMIGLPEARIILAQATTFCATCPKSNASYMALEKAAADVQQDRVQPVPAYLRDGSYASAAKLGHGQGYQYPHDAPGKVVDQQYLTVPTRYYEPTDQGYEARLAERLHDWEAQRQAVREAQNGNS